MRCRKMRMFFRDELKSVEMLPKLLAVGVAPSLHELAKAAQVFAAAPENG